MFYEEVGNTKAWEKDIGTARGAGDSSKCEIVFYKTRLFLYSDGDIPVFSLNTRLK